MQQKKYLWSLYLIITTIVISLTVQVYFNFKNYQINKQQFFSQVQNSLDIATENYFVDLAKNNYPNWISNSDLDSLFTKTTVTSWSSDHDEISVTIDKTNSKNKDSILSHFQTIQKIIVSDNKTPKKNRQFINKTNNKHLPEKFILTSNNPKDSLQLITGLTSIYLSITNDSLDFKRLNLLFQKELERNNITLPYRLNHYKNKKIISSNDNLNFGVNTIKTLAKSTYLNKNEKIELQFPNQTKTILKRGLLGILLSLLLATAIIASLFYLLNIIKKQKVIAEIKNDFISNITHEFKTPITTIGLAVESIKNFNAVNNNAKAEEYLDITKNQLGKLNVMVEKILETAILDSKELLLKKERVDVVNLIEKCIAKHKIIQQTKTLNFKTITKELFLNIDIFHFENAISNLIDNAIKYGGNIINIEIQELKQQLIILVSDSGIIPKNQKDKIFDKFYRIPKGNTHDIKGFGIGLYYTKKIIEKHNGTLELTNTKNTIFQIQLPLVG